MSRIGLKPISLPAGVAVTVDADNNVTVKGPKGELQRRISDLITVTVSDNEVVLSRNGESKTDRSLHGLSRTLVFNMVVGVTEGFEKKLILNGVGYKAEKKGNKLALSLGLSHPLELEDPAGITTETPDVTTILVKGINKEEVGNYAANIRAYRKPEPYKGKGIKYADEVIRRKEGKAGVKG